MINSHLNVITPSVDEPDANIQLDRFLLHMRSMVFFFFLLDMQSIEMHPFQRYGVLHNVFTLRYLKKKNPTNDQTNKQTNKNLLLNGQMSGLNNIMYDWTKDLV